MHLGIDFGTTRTVVALADRGNYPVVDFLDVDGDFHDHFPTVSALSDGQLVHGFAAQAAAREGASLIRSVKRHLAAPDLTLESSIEVDGQRIGLLDLVTGFLTALREALQGASTLGEEELTEAVVVGVPAHAHTAQRMLTLEAFRRAGFSVAAMVNEPSAAGFEYTHRQRRTVTSRRNRVLVYDLGGGTFDASLVSVENSDHEVLGTVGINRLGGDDFDLLLAECVLDKAGVAEQSLPERALDELVDQCRGAKEGLTPQTRRLAVELDGQLVALDVADYYAAATPLVEQSLQAMTPLVAGLDASHSDIAGIYLVGGSSSLPLVPRVLRERFGRRVHRSPYPGASTAIGLAIAADPEAGYTLAEQLSRGFGVFREAEGGREVRLDPILSPDHRVSLTDEVVVTRRYRAAHNIGWFRFVEYGRLDEQGQPVGELSPRGEMVFGFEASLQDAADLSTVPVRRLDHGPLVEETYTIDPHGIITVTITDLDTGHSLSNSLG
ncbi:MULTISPECIES: Hsp70 family protein [unclassified Luteococcus]|uniref:Hsp70 family protein n=1 Tax=unclassified Luteococcus TaxID=2639923 RepID=UPI00313B808F